MRSKGNAPTAAQKRWMEAVRELGSVISGGAAVVHHAVGATGKHNKVAIGHWWLIPLTDEEHKGLHNGAKPWLEKRYLNEFEGLDRRIDFEKRAFEKIYLQLWAYHEVPDSDIVAAIMGYHK